MCSKDGRIFNISNAYLNKCKSCNANFYTLHCWPRLACLNLSNFNHSGIILSVIRTDLILKVLA